MHIDALTLLGLGAALAIAGALFTLCRLHGSCSRA
jgi:hypothetical protein